MDSVTLQQKNNSWQFTSEAALENFVWSNLEEIFRFKPLNRQYVSGGEICDIIAIDKNKSLVIIELKNTEDRYIIQQLTRYYARLIKKKPFSQEIDYSQPVRLISLAPSYHANNLVDKSYSQLKFELFLFSISRDENNFFFDLSDISQGELSERFLIPCQILEDLIKEDVGEPPELFIKWLGGCTLDEQRSFLTMRRKLLGCSPRMKEMIDRRSIQYGSGKTRLCAEILFKQKTQKPVLFLWLPTPNTFTWGEKRKITIGRLRTWTDGQTISHVGHVPKGFGKMKTEEEWEQVPFEKRPRMVANFSSKSRTPVKTEMYLKTTGFEDRDLFWDALTNLAIEKWLEKS